MTRKLKYSIFLFCSLPMVASANFYAGADLAYQDYNLKSTITTNGPISNFTTNSTTTITSSGHGARGGIFGGYESRFASSMNLGGEIRASISNTQVNAKSQGTATSSSGSLATENVNGTLKEKYSLDIRFKPGYFLTDSTVIYFFVGYAAEKDNVTGNVNASLATTSGVNDFTINTSFKKTGWQHGYELGIGTQVYLNQGWAVRSEIRQVNYNTLTFSRSSAILKAYPSVTEGSIGIVKVFC